LRGRFFIAVHHVKNPLIIGGGLVGLATAWQLLRSGRVPSLTLLEKESRVGAHQSTHNSGVLHAGLYYQPGSLKARLAVEGIREMTAYCREKNIPHEICGKVVVAVDESEVPRLRGLQTRGHANGLAGLRWLDRDGLRAIEPHAAGVAALHVPEEGIVDYAAVCEALRSDILAMNGRIVTGAEVVALHEVMDGWTAATKAGDFTGDFLVNCAGLHSDRVCRLAGLDPADRIVPFRGEYYQLRPEAAHLVHHLIYPVPDPKFPFLGVHFTRLISGGVEAGPNAVLAFAREAYRKTQWNARDLAEALSFPGLWKFLARHPRMAWDEGLRSKSRKLFCRSLQRLVPDLREGDLAPGGAGVRAQAISSEGELVQDFRLVSGSRALHVVNAPSPAATASLAIGREVMQRIAGG
jgi:L-2-hydroxyglutarate oxidase